MKQLTTYIVDAFTDEVFKGNQAGVCLSETALSEELMQAIAKELGLSETAFVTPNAKDGYDIRFFSPVTEIPLCGHATLASSKVLFEQNPSSQHVAFTNVQGILLEAERSDDHIKMKFPVYYAKEANAPKALLQALGVKEATNVAYTEETNMLLVEIADSNVLRNLKPDFAALKKSHDSISGVVVTSKSQAPDIDFESRYFWPWVGTNEDPVTGATHTFLTPYWSERLNKKTMNALQSSERTGKMEVALIDEYWLSMKSDAQVVLEGFIRLPNGA